MKNSTLWWLAFTICGFHQIFSQQELQLTSKDSIVLSSWTVGLGYTIIDDSATPFGEDFLNIKDTWHALPYPSSISLGRSFKNGLGIKAIGSYNVYKVGKKVDGAINQAERKYYAIDGMISYDLNKLIGETGWFDPFLHVGAGYSSIGGLGRSTANAGFGFNTWFSDKWGLNFNTIGKWGIPEGSTKQLQHSAGVVYRFGVEKGLSKKGTEKLALIDALAKERQRQQDSIAAVNRAKEEAALAERLAQEREQERLAAAEKARLDAENLHQKKMDELANLDKVHFKFDSSDLLNSDKTKLSQLVDFMNKYPETKIVVKGHTDSRGPSKYNDRLSEQRAENALQYIVSSGISSERISAKGYGESQILNRCVDGVACSAEEHQLNRRVEYELN